jgi:hypothetical protein
MDNTNIWSITMKAPTALELAMLNEQNDDRKNRSLDEKQHRASRMLPVPLYKTNFGTGRHVLSTALFGVTKSGKGKVEERGEDDRKTGERKDIKKVFPSFRGNATIEYQGPELRQDDETVHLGLVHCVRDTVVDDCVSFDPREFVKGLGWDAHKKSVDKLKDCIERMQSAMVRLTVNENTGHRAALVGSFTWTPERWSVRLDANLLSLFEGGTTFLPRAQRAKLTDGLQTWLASFLLAQNDEVVFSLADLHKFCGSEAAVKTFGEQVRETLPKLVAVGVVKDFGFRRGKLIVERKLPGKD